MSKFVSSMSQSIDMDLDILVTLTRLRLPPNWLPCYHTRMTSQLHGDRILVVDEDRQILDLLANQVLIPLGYRVETESEGSQAVERALAYTPDLIIVSLTVPGLTGKDLLFALRSQGVEVPVIVTATEGKEADAIQAFRLGAVDYLVKPLREAEVVAALERALNEMRLRRERQELSDQLRESNRQLERRVRELTTMYGIGKVVTSTTDQRKLFSKLMEGSIYVAEADMGWMLLQDEKSDHLVLRAQRNLPPPFSGRLHQPWNDGVSSLVMLSGQALSIHGEGLAQFELSQFCEAALIAPTKVRDQPIGVLCVARESAKPFSERDQAMLEAVADYASISLVNARLFQALEARAKRLQQVVNHSETTSQIDPQQWAGARQIAKSIRMDISQILVKSSDPEVNEGLEKISAQVEALLEQISVPNGLDSGEENHQPA
ncbi:MAG: response regulator [Anaerolineales bacterium]|nr:response regulator [Anaerolineales bacterium]